MFGLYEVGLVGEVGDVWFVRGRFGGEVRDVWFVRGRFGWGGWRCLV